MHSTSKKECKRSSICHNMYRAVVNDSVPFLEAMENCKCFFGNGSIMSFHFTEGIGSETNR